MSPSNNLVISYFTRGQSNDKIMRGEGSGLGPAVVASARAKSSNPNDPLKGVGGFLRALAMPAANGIVGRSSLMWPI